MDLLDIINKKRDGLFVFLLVITSLLFLVGLGQRHLWEADEPREAGIMAEMSGTGDYVVPRLNGAPFLEKPPVYYWISSAVFHLLGENDYSCRVPSALASIGGVLLVYGLARKMGSSPLTAFVSGFILATSAEYWNLGHQCLVDMTLCFFVTASMVCFFSAVKAAPFRILWDIGFVLSLAAALMTKGLVGLAIPASAIFTWLLLERNFSLRPWLLLFAGSILCLIPAAIWVWLLCRKLGQQFVYDAILANNFGRFTGGYAQHVGPFYYYLKNFPGQFMPWFLFVPMAVFSLVRDIRLKKHCESLFVLAWFVIPFILLSIAAGKRAMYLLPIYPAAALFVGIALGTVIEGKKFPGFWFDIPAAIVAWAAIICPLGLMGSCIYFKQPLWFWPLVAIPGLFLALWAYQKLLKKDLKRFILLLAPALMVIFITFDAAVMPISNKGKSFEPLFDYCKNLQSQNVQIGLWGPKERISGAAVFYLKKTRIPSFTSDEEAMKFLNSPNSTAVILEKETFDKYKVLKILKDFRIDHRTYIVASLDKQRVVK